MYIDKEQANNLIKEFSSSLINEVNNKMNSMLDLLDSDDWSMIIKSHALIELIVTELITAKNEKNELKQFFERLPLSDEQIGKLKITKDYNILTSKQRNFVRKFSELRNLVVHKFENINFNLKEYINSFEKNKKKAWVKNIVWYSEDNNDTRIQWEKITSDNPILGLWFSTMMFVSLTMVSTKELEGLNAIKKISDNTITELLKPQK